MNWHLDVCCQFSQFRDNRRIYNVLRFPTALPRLVVIALAMLLTLPMFSAPVFAQYGGISGLFVTTSPTNSGVADFSGLGCRGGDEVVLYFPGLLPTVNDPVATQSVPGRVIGVTTATTSTDPLLDGTFAFPNITLPTDIEPGVYEVRARCGELDVRVLVQVDAAGEINTVTDPTAPVENETPGSADLPVLPFTGRESSRLISGAAGLIAAGVAFLALSRRHLSRS